jgi:dTDP-4-dehydrorhamnose 3,5-epimerase
VRFEETPLAGSFFIDPEPVADERGFFARTFCSREFAARGMKHQFVQCSISFSARRGTLRGMHYQRTPHEEAKLVRCTAGAIFDAIIDLRPGSPTRGRWAATELSAANHRILYVPEGFAHGFQTLEDGCEVAYQISTVFHPEASAGVRWDDPAFGIVWPEVETRVIADRDRSYLLWQR